MLQRELTGHSMKSKQVHAELKANGKMLSRARKAAKKAFELQKHRRSRLLEQVHKAVGQHKAKLAAEDEMIRRVAISKSVSPNLSEESQPKNQMAIAANPSQFEHLENLPKGRGWSYVLNSLVNHSNNSADKAYKDKFADTQKTVPNSLRATPKNEWASNLEKQNMDLQRKLADASLRIAESENQVKQLARHYQTALADQQELYDECITNESKEVQHF